MATKILAADNTLRRKAGTCRCFQNAVLGGSPQPCPWSATLIWPRYSLRVLSSTHLMAMEKGLVPYSSVCACWVGHGATHSSAAHMGSPRGAQEDLNSGIGALCPLAAAFGSPLSGIRCQVLGGSRLSGCAARLSALHLGLPLEEGGRPGLGVQRRKVPSGCPTAAVAWH